MKIVVIVSGGNVQDIYCSDPDADVVMLDYDNGEEDGTTGEMDEAAEKAEKELHHVY